MATRNPHHGKFMACCLMHSGDAVQKGVNNVVAKTKTKRTAERVDSSPAGFNSTPLGHGRQHQQIG